MAFRGTGDAKTLAFLLNNRGAVFEGDLFHLLLQSPYVVRSFEFALADGAVLCDDSLPTATTFADRFAYVYSELGSVQGKRILLFDVKGKKAPTGLGGAPAHKATSLQKRRVAFYIATCAANEGYVEVIPNFDQADGLAEDVEEEDVGAKQLKSGFLYNSRISRLPRSAWTLDPTGSPYRMPRGLLLEAIRLMRQSFLTDRPYRNPWTRVAADDWRPRASTSPKGLTPAAHIQHFGAFKAAIEIQRALRVLRPPLPLQFDFIGLQPRLADFKFVSCEPWVPESPDGTPKQWLVQHKRDAVPARSSGCKLNRVRIGRTDGDSLHYYFSHVDRFDFFLYEFEYSDGQRGFFFMPECAIPDEFYTSPGIEGDFEPLRDFYYAFDSDGHWLRFLWRIIQKHPQPRKPGYRPRRINETAEARASIDDSIEAHQLAVNELHGRHRYRNALNRSQRQFYDGVMGECARRSSDILIPLCHENPVADFAMCRYRWTAQESARFLDDGTPPLILDDLRGDTPELFITFYTRAREVSFNGPPLTTAQFRRLNACDRGRLFIWDLWSSDSIRPAAASETSVSTPEDTCDSVVIIPSLDLRPNEAQRQLFCANQQVDTTKQHTDNTPDISQLLASGLLFSDYVVGSPGQHIYEGDHGWSECWILLHAFLTRTSCEHPMGYPRNCTDYRHPLRVAHEALVRDQRSKR